MGLRRPNPIHVGDTVDRRVGFVVVASGHVIKASKNSLVVEITYTTSGVYTVGQRYVVPVSEWTKVREDAW